MRVANLLLIGLFGCGRAAGPACARNTDCDDDQLCDDGACEDIYGAAFDFHVVSANLPRDRDYGDGGGAPDPYVRILIGDETCITSVVPDSYDPVWCETCRLTAREGPWSVELHDEDPEPNDSGWYGWGGKKLVGPARAARDGVVDVGEKGMGLVILVEPAP